MFDIGSIAILHLLDLPMCIVSKCYLFVDDVKLICSSDNIGTLSVDFRKTCLSTETCDMKLNVNKWLLLHLAPGAPQNWIMPDSYRISPDLPLSVVVDRTFRSSAQVAKAVA